MTKMSTLIVVVISFITVTGFFSCVEALEVGSQKFDISASETYVSRYIWRGQDLYGDNDAAHQPSVDIVAPEAVFGADVGINLWASFPLSRGHENGEEFDYTVSVAKTLFESVDVSFGYTYFDFPNTGSTADVSEPWAALTFNNIIPALPIEIAANIFAGYDFQATSGGPDEGWYYSWGFSTDIALPNCVFAQEGQLLSFGVTNWGQDGVADLKPSSIYATDLSMATEYSLGVFSISPSINYSINHEDTINNGDDEFWAGITFAYAL